MAEKNGAFGHILKCWQLLELKPTVKQQCLASLAALVDGYPDVVTQKGIELLSTSLEEVDKYLFSVTLEFASACS